MLTQQSQPPSNEWLQWASVILPIIVILTQTLAPKFAQWRRNRAEDQQEEYKANQEMRRINDMQSAGWEKLYLIQKGMIEDLTEENNVLKTENKVLREK